MPKIFTLISVALLVSLSAMSQKNPSLNKDSILGGATDKTKAQKEMKKAQKYYRMGVGTHDEALKYYLRLHEYYTNDPALNYKIAACYLGGSNKKAALQYLLSSEPSVAKDYYFLLGKAYQYNYQYTEAREAFEKHFELQNKWNRKGKLNQLMQQKRECTFGQVALQDSTPVFIFNLGPVVNTYYDDYGAVNVSEDSLFYFTSRRPDKEPSRRVSRFKFNEQIILAEGSLQDDPTLAQSLKGLRGKKHYAVAGYDHQQDLLYYYKGKKRTGEIYTTDVVKGKAKKRKSLNGAVNHIAYKETSIAIDDNGMAYFISDRRGGEGGKDIWYCKKKGKNRYARRRNIGDLINTPFDEECVYVTPNGKTLYFSSNGHDGMGGFDVFKSEKQENGTWGEPINLGYPINSPSDELFYRTTQNPDIALYSAVRADGHGGLDIYKIIKDNRIPFTLSGVVTDQKSQDPLQASLNVFDLETNELVASAVSDSISQLYSMAFEDVSNYFIQVDAEGYESLGDTIICPTERHAELIMNFELNKLKSPFTIRGYVRDSATYEPVLATINCYDAVADTLLTRQVTNEENGKYSVTFADKYLLRIEISAEDYFTLKDSINTQFIDSAYIKRTYDLVSSKTLYYLDGKVQAEGMAETVDASLLFYQSGEAYPFEATDTDSLGMYKVVFDSAGPFEVEVKSEGYFFINDSIQFLETDSLHKTVDFTLKKMQRGAKIVVENILFNSGKTSLQPTSFAQLDKLANLLNENRDIRIEVSGHTDNTGSATVNKKLSKARALAVRNYLITKGVEEERLEYEGYGLDQPIAPNNTAEGRAQNRRVEIKVIE